MHAGSSVLAAGSSFHGSQPPDEVMIAVAADAAVAASATGAETGSLYADQDVRGSARRIVDAAVTADAVAVAASDFEEAPAVEVLVSVVARTVVDMEKRRTEKMESAAEPRRM